MLTVSDRPNRKVAGTTSATAVSAPSVRWVESSVVAVILVAFGLAIHPNNLPGPMREVRGNKSGPWGKDPRAVQAIWQGEENPARQNRGQSRPAGATSHVVGALAV